MWSYWSSMFLYGWMDFLIGITVYGWVKKYIDRLITKLTKEIIKVRMDKFFFLCLIFILVGGLCTVGSMVDPFIDPGNTVGENIIATIKMRNNFWLPFIIFPILR